MKKMFWSMLTIFTILFLASCGTNNDNDPTTGSEEQEKEAKVSTQLNVDANGEAMLLIKNPADNEMTLTFPSGQEVEYQLLDQDKNVVYTYSANKNFTQAIQEKKLKPNEEISVKLDLENELAEVPAGKYKLVVWSMASELSDQKVESDYEWAGTEQAEESAPPTEGNSKITLYREDANAEFVEPYEVEIDPSEDKVKQIFEEIDATNVGLLEYRFENDEKKLVLVMDKATENIQGTAGEYLFLGKVLHSYFENYPKLEEIDFVKEDGTPVELSHMGAVSTFTRDEQYTKPN
ncbi:MULTISPECIES: BsuPI-related putative proteinase inhibitor [unclassified Psychrobacillus]|uniref:BsuPI-related putative proteinase inhibitor n=1 Tax=unclassified Psychrobacillus TaxID=2636677 RepID=UPI00146C201F|nr:MULTISPECIES: BsuPI-related putative proteinase inhibitor [unclassified Psychrobacillus]MCM3358229.1 BsuPI-related putative proteinase inhibitor [Psychrobacillus sp. MER TA 171]NME05480.1 hypothetical protein [Psychrobacillus sp. BL-248-WT-3]